MPSCNMSILWQNCILQYETEIAQKAWIWFAETHGNGMQYEADTFAHEVETLVLSTKPLIELAAKNFDAENEVCDSLLSFILQRHANAKLGGNVHPTYCTAVT